MTNSSDYTAPGVKTTDFDSSTVIRKGLECQSQGEYERILIRRVQLGDGAAFDLLIQPHRRRLEATILKIVRNAQDAEDVVQQCLLKIFVKLDQFRGDSQFSTLVTRVGINQSLMFLRSSRRYLMSIDSPSDKNDLSVSMDLPVPGRSIPSTPGRRRTRDCSRQRRK